MPPAVHGAIIDYFRRTAGIRGLSENGRYRHNEEPPTRSCPIEPITLAIATAIAAKSAESVTGPAISALTKWGREKFSGMPLESALLAAAEAGPAHAEALAAALGQAAAAAPGVRQ